jgi:hypothetical protein
MYAEWDVSSFDLSILSGMLMNYMHAVRYWIKEEDTWQYRFFLYMLEYAAEALSYNVVQWFRDFLLVVGMMPSGSSETSHGDTWIMLIYFVMTFIFHVMSKVSADIRKKIASALLDILIVAIAYGDDCNYVYPRELRDYIGVDKLVEFATVMYNAKMRNVNEHTSLATYLKYDSRYGCTGYVYRGPVFLKRYYVFDHNFREKGTPQIMPWRQTAAYIWRVGMPKDPSGNSVEMLSRLIGLVYDTMGVDPYQYQLIADMYALVYTSVQEKMTLEQLYLIVQEGLKRDDKYFRKVGLSSVAVRFPTLEELHLMNRLDWDVHAPYSHRSWQEWVTEDTWW